MPIYVYRCADCNVETEKRQGFSDAPLTTCETCGGAVRRVLQPAGVIFKGSGFYSTDYRNGAAAKKSTTESGDSSSAASSDSGAGEKSDKKATSDAPVAKPEGGEKKSQPAASASKSE
jgi:putative FmdB family regulatory protein